MTVDAPKALKHRVIYLFGDEEVLRRRALDAILAEAGLVKDDFDLETFSGDAGDPIEWIGGAGTSPFMAERRCVVVRNVLRCDPDKASLAELTSLPASALLILVADDESGSEDRVTRMKTTVSKGWQALVTKAKGIALEFKADNKSSRQALLTEVKELGRSMTPAAADTLIEMTGGSLSRSLEELEKLLIFVDKDVQIKDSDVRELVVPSREWSVFKMTEATLEGRVPEALSQLRVLVGTAAKAEDVAFRSILPVVSSQLRLVWQARLLIEAGATPSRAPAEITSQFPAKPNITKEKEFRQNKAMSMARTATFAKLDSCFQILSDTDSRLKGLLSGFSSFDTLELMILGMAGTFAPKPANRR